MTDRPTLFGESSSPLMPGGGEFGRSAKREVRNPILALLALPEAREIMALPEAQRRPLGILLRLLATRTDQLAEEAWRKRKGIMAFYWRVVTTYAKHIARAVDPRP